MTTLYCGFCGKSQHEVAKLIAGPGVHICNECTDMCHDIVHPPGESRPPRPTVPFATWISVTETLSRRVLDLQRELRRAQLEADTDRPKAEKAEVIGFGEDAIDARDLRLARIEDALSGEDLVPAEMMRRLSEGDDPPVKIWREHRGLTPAELAARAGVPLAVLCEIESGEKNDVLRALGKTARALGVEIDELVP